MVIPIHYPSLEGFSPKVKKLVQNRFQQKTDFDKLRTLHLQDDISIYPQQLDTIILSAPLQKAWKTYCKTPPQESWAGPMVNFVFAYSPLDRKLYYKGVGQMPDLQEGMQFYCWLNILGPRLIIGLKLLSLDEENNVMEIAYIEGGLYRGTQILTFSEIDASTTQIKHQSYYKSESRLRDATLYPFFHKMTVGEFHQRKKKQIEGVV